MMSVKPNICKSLLHIKQFLSYHVYLDDTVKYSRLNFMIINHALTLVMDGVFRIGMKKTSYIIIE